MNQDKILVSACLLGEKVRYDGGSQLIINEILDVWRAEGRIVSLCPEVVGGLSIPRQPAEIQSKYGRVITCDNQDVTTQFVNGANKALQLCQQLNIRFALLKESSPSCGSTDIYDGSFTGNKVLGEGITAKLLRENGIKVYSEKSIATLIEEIKATAAYKN